jgi:thiosulfate dehydrogenase (quinone) large subunit
VELEVSRRQQGSRRVPDRRGGGHLPPPPPPAAPSAEPPGPSIREQLASATVAARALLPLRFFLGVTFVYAGLDKLVDRTFFDPASPASISGQLAAFARVSPLAPLVRVSEPFALPIGLLIALAEIAIGLGALSGLAFRAAAAGGAVLSLLFWLTASWTTQPYYYGADLPYALGWITLGLAGTGGLLVPRVIRDLGAYTIDESPEALRASHGYGIPVEASPGRRQLLQVGVLGVAALVAGSLTVPMRLVGLGGGGTTGSAGRTGEPVTAGAPAAAGPSESVGAPAAGGPATPQGADSLAVAKIQDLESRGAVRIRIPADAPAPLPAGDPGIIVKLPDGTYAAYDARCTHEGCPVGWDAQDNVMVCPCHGAAFDPADHGAVLGGPTNTPLMELPISVDQAGGTISLVA